MMHVLFIGGQTLTFIVVFRSLQHSLEGTWDSRTFGLTLMTFFFLSSSIFVPSLINLQDDMRNIYDKVTNRYSSKINRRPITLVSLILKQTYEEQLKLKKGEIIKKESLYIKGNLFSNKILFCFDDNVIF
jgi:hypothetical protein